GTPFTSRIVAPGVELKGSGVYLVAPPSTHPNGRPYVWDLGHHADEMAPARLPAWLASTLPSPTDRLQRDAGALQLLPGQRHSQLLKLGGLFGRYGLRAPALAETLLVVNRHHCRPPIDEREVRAIAASLDKLLAHVPPIPPAPLLPNSL